MRMVCVLIELEMGFIYVLVSFVLLLFDDEKLCKKNPRNPWKKICILHEGPEEI